MTSIVYDYALGLLDTTTLQGDIRAILVMTNTTADTEKDKQFISEFTTLDEYDGAGYARVACTSESFTVDTVNHHFKFTCDPITFAALGAGTRQCQGILLYLHVTNDADSKPLMYIDGTGFPFAGSGGDVVFTPNASGVMYTVTA